MKFYYAGFNLYGQIIHSIDYVINSFTVFEHEQLEKIELGHFCTLLQCKKSTYLHGAFNNKNFQEVKLKLPENIIQICMNDDKILMLDIHGKLFKIALDDLHNVQDVPNFIHNECENAVDKIIKLACNANINVFLTQQSKLFTFSSLLNANINDIADICAGLEHCLILDKLGNIYSFGQGSRGQLGHGLLENEVNPKQIEALAGIRMVKIAAGGWHSCALSKDGDLYTWGWNSNGQLGLDSKEEVEKQISVMATPHVVDIDTENQSNVINVSCGNRHTVFLLDDNRLFGMGWNKYHQLGNEPKSENTYKPTFLCKFTKKVSNLKCGTWSTVVY